MDGAIFAVAFVLAYVIRFEGAPGEAQRTQLALWLPYLVLGRLACNHAFGVYRIAWRFVSLRDVPRVAASIAVPSVVFLALRLFTPQHFDVLRIPLSIIAVDAMVGFLGVLGLRVARRWMGERRAPVAGGAQPVILIGAGAMGYVISREIRNRPELGLQVAGFVDDDLNKSGETVDGVRVLGLISDLPKIAAAVDAQRAIITIAKVTAKDMRRIVEICEGAKLRMQIVPAIHELVDGTVSVSRVRDVEVEDLLGREPVQLDSEAIARFVGSSHVMVTGAGGSIGSEMCRQVCRFRPESLVLVERGENNLFEIERELRAAFPDVRIVPCIADVADRARMDEIFAATTPRLVIHAAAYKHVPLMEENISEAVKNNVGGTLALAEAAQRHQVDCFVMISTDKAVRPTSVMGATKRIAEMVVQALGRESPATRFITVRFGNVLGSVGSVVPIFKRQIAAGGPVTVTHPEMQRYFMTIPEASQLVLQAASMGRGGEIFVLDMGEPVKVLSLAEQLIRLSGLRPHEDIEILFTGVRPGEKLFEEIALDEEAVTKTKHPKIYIGRLASIPGDQVRGLVADLTNLGEQRGPQAVRERMMAFVRQGDPAPPALPPAAVPGRSVN